MLPKLGWLLVAPTGAAGWEVLALQHLRRRHPERPVPTERELYEEYLRTRYADRPTRCC